MPRQRYFPKQVAQRPEWFLNFATQLVAEAPTLGYAPADIAEVVKDAKFCAYVAGIWLTTARDAGPGATATVQTLYTGDTAAPMVLPTYTPPPPDAGVVAVKGGALTRIFNFIAAIKRLPTYTEAIGIQLRIVGPEDTTEHPVPTFRLKVERGGGCECVRLEFNAYDHDGVVIYSRRAGATEWEKLAVDLHTPYLDERPLLQPNTPEIREYRLQSYDDEGPTGPFTDPQSVTVSP